MERCAYLFIATCVVLLVLSFERWLLWRENNLAHKEFWDQVEKDLDEWERLRKAGETEE